MDPDLRYEATFIFYWIFAKFFTNFGEHFGDLNFLFTFCQIVHQFWWNFWWIEEIGEFLSDKNVTNSGDNNSFRFWMFFVTNLGENLSESLKISIKKSQKLAKIQGNHQNWWQFCRKSMWSHICQKCSQFFVNILVIWIFFRIFGKFFTNFGENFGDLKKLVSF